MKRKKEPAKNCFDCQIRNKSIFADLDRDACSSVDNVRQTLLFTADQDLTLKTNQKSGFYCLQTGHARLFYKNEKKNNTVRICVPGDLIGYGDWYTGDKHGVVTLNQGVACHFDRDQFAKQTSDHCKITEGLIKGLCKIINLKDERISGLENHSVKNRMCALLYNLTKKFGVNTDDGILIDLSIDRKTLAELSGTVIESFARLITQLESENILKRVGRKILILDKDKLIKNANI